MSNTSHLNTTNNVMNTKGKGLPWISPLFLACLFLETRSYLIAQAGLELVISLTCSDFSDLLRIYNHPTV